MAKGRAIRTCNCALRPASHKVQDENAHRLELEAFVRSCILIPSLSLTHCKSLGPRMRTPPDMRMRLRTLV